jgi:mannonate dehydratase
MPILGWMRTSLATSSRGGAVVSGCDYSRLAGLPLTSAGVVDAETLWSSLEWFLARVCPVAEEAGVVLALHPDDPPISPIRGIARIMSSVESFERLLELSPSSANAITFCQGNFTLVSDDVPSLIRHLGDRRSGRRRKAQLDLSAHRSASSGRSHRGMRPFRARR